MYEFSRALYRGLSDEIDTTICPAAHARVLDCCEATIGRLAADPDFCPRPARQLFKSIRGYFPLSAQPHVWAVVEHHVARAGQSFAQARQGGLDSVQSRRACWAKIRDGSSCRREPLPGTRYCPSHKQLDDGVAQAAIALAA